MNNTNKWDTMRKL